tara:strand:+ start:333 stop:512 length:180 start_codon:yes stop_codon:yes gene_type:complete
MPKSTIAKYNKQDIFFFLDGLRQSGIINMVGAPRVLEDYFEMSKPTAKKYFQEWVESKN